MVGNEIVKRVLREEYEELMKKHEGKIRISSHAADRLSTGQRKVFREIDVIRPLLQERPVYVGLQKNGRYSIFFRRTEGFMRIILEIGKEYIVVITFMYIEILPRMLGRENGK